MQSRESWLGSFLCQLKKRWKKWSTTGSCGEILPHTELAGKGFIYWGKERKERKRKEKKRRTRCWCQHLLRSQSQKSEHNVSRSEWIACDCLAFQWVIKQSQNPGQSLRTKARTGESVRRWRLPPLEHLSTVKTPLQASGQLFNSKLKLCFFILFFGWCKFILIARTLP